MEHCAIALTLTQCKFLTLRRPQDQLKIIEIIVSTEVLRIMMVCRRRVRDGMEELLVGTRMSMVVATHRFQIDHTENSRITMKDL